MDSNRSYENIIDPNLFNYRRSAGKYAVKSAAHSAGGLLLGVGIDKVCSKLQRGLNIKPALMILIQLVVIVIVFYTIEMYITKQFKYAMEWQNITPGLLFAGLFFGSQSNLFENIKTFFKPL
jgi:hypothetical protein